MRNSFKLLLQALGVSAMFYAGALRADVNDRGFDYADWAAVLERFVDDAGMVNYKGLKAGRERLDAFVVAIGSLGEKNCKKWSEEEKIALWLNAYNALTLKVIIDNYPIKPSFFKSMYYPKNSIRQIRGVWDKISFAVMGADYTLGHIEHEILRKEFDEPRIHMAMVCAAMGCPPLRNEPYRGERLDEQLNDQSKKFLGDADKFKIDYDKARLHISPIFKWFGGDFVKLYGKDEEFRGHKNPQAAVVKFITEHLPEEQRQRWGIDSRTYKISYLNYDWSLNEQQ